MINAIVNRRDPGSGLEPPLVKAMAIAAGPGDDAVPGYAAADAPAGAAHHESEPVQWLICVLLAAALPIVVEISKAVRRRRSAPVGGPTTSSGSLVRAPAVPAVGPVAGARAGLSTPPAYVAESARAGRFGPPARGEAPRTAHRQVTHRPDASAGLRSGRVAPSQRRRAAVLDDDDHLDADWLYEIGSGRRRVRRDAPDPSHGTGDGRRDEHDLVGPPAATRGPARCCWTPWPTSASTPREVHESAGGSRPTDDRARIRWSRPIAACRTARCDFPACSARRRCTTWAGPTGWFGRRWSGCARPNADLRVVLGPDGGESPASTTCSPSARLRAEPD